MTETTDNDFHDYINFEYYLQNIGKYRNRFRLWLFNFQIMFIWLIVIVMRFVESRLS